MKQTQGMPKRIVSLKDEKNITSSRYLKLSVQKKSLNKIQSYTIKG